jgi:hypothetical protein
MFVSWLAAVVDGLAPRCTRNDLPEPPASILGERGASPRVAEVLEPRVHAR